MQYSRPPLYDDGHRMPYRPPVLWLSNPLIGFLKKNLRVVKLQFSPLELGIGRFDLEIRILRKISV